MTLLPASSFSYRLLRPVLFRLDAEHAHELGLAALETLSRSPAATACLGTFGGRPDARLRSDVLGLSFSHPVGLAAGFDKDARAVAALAALGFAFVEVGTVTPRPQPGNERPRLFRLGADGALVNRLGFNSGGALRVAERLRRVAGAPCVVGVNLGKNRDTPVEAAVDDYLQAREMLHGCGDYLVVNVSSPNTPGLRDLQGGPALRRLVGALTEEERAAAGSAARPVLVKLAPDLDAAGLDEALDAGAAGGAAGFIATNTTVARPDALVSRRHREEEGGLSGAPLFARALEVVSTAFRRFDGRLPVVGVGGVTSAERAWRLIRAGASLVQVYTGFVYGGPAFPRVLRRELGRRVEEAALASVAEAVGADA